MIRSPYKPIVAIFVCCLAVGCGRAPSGSDATTSNGSPGPAVPSDAAPLANGAAPAASYQTVAASQTSVEPEPAIALDEVLPTISSEDAEKHMGEEVFVIGKVDRTGRSNGGHVFLNFGEEESGTQLTGFIRNLVAERFATPPDEMFDGKTVKIRGDLYLFDGEPNIGIGAPSHVTIVADGTEPAGAPDVRATAPEIGESITVASYNVLNLFDAKDDPYHGDEGTSQKPRAALDMVAASIRSLNADVLALVEVENRGILDHFNKALLADLGYRHVVQYEGNDRRGIDVALLSRLPVGPVTSFRHVRFPDANGEQIIGFRRDLLQARIEPEDGLPFDVYVVHFKSKGGGGQGLSIRLAEARQVRVILEERLASDPQAAFVVCGDFNDTIDSEPLKALVGSGETALVSFFDEVPEDERVTFNQEPFLSMIDFILASPAMAARYESGSYQIAPGSPGTTGSDHNPVAARFRIR